MLPIINACLGILCRRERQSVLLACRPAGKVLAGFWEFPGGKLEAGEDSFVALRRELAEEINIVPRTEAMQLIGQIEHEYPHGLAKLDLILLTEWDGEIKALEQQELSWYDLHTQTPPLAPLLPTTERVLALVRQMIATNRVAD